MVVSAKIRNPKTTKRLILHAAEAIFAEKGFAGNIDTGNFREVRCFRPVDSVPL